MARGSSLRLLVVGASWPPQTFLGRLMRGLTERGVDVTIAFSRRPDQEWFYASGLKVFRTRAWEGPRLLRLGHLAWLAFRAVARSPRDVRRFWRSAKENPGLPGRLAALNRLLPFAGASFDVVYFPWNSAAITYLPVLKRARASLVSCRGSQVNVAPHDPRRAIGRQLPSSFSSATRVHCVSNAIKREAERFGLSESKARVIHPGIDTEFFSPLPHRDSASHLRLVMVASLVWVKGTTYAVRAVSLLRDKGIPVRLTLIGAGPERQRLLYEIHELDLRKHVDLVGRLPPVAVRDRLRRSDVFILSSLSEGFCNAAIEAMGCGLPVVMTRCGGMSEGVTDGVEGFVVPVRDPVAMAEAVAKLAQDPDLRSRMGAAGRQRVMRQFTLSRHVDAFVKLLEEVRDCRSA